jgi:hypothetical protein
MPTVGNWERRARRMWAKASVCGEEIGRVHTQGYHALGCSAARLRTSGSCPVTAAKTACQLGVRLRQDDWSVSRSQDARRGMLLLICVRFQPYRGKPYVRLIGGREET